MRLFEGAEYDSRTKFDVEEADLIDIRPEFLFDLRLDELEKQVPAYRELFDIVIRFADARLHQGFIVFRNGLGDVPYSWKLAPEWRSRFSWGTGVTATVFLVLKESRVPKPGEPFLKGHWIARKDFKIGVKRERHSFPLERWTPSDFARHGLPEETAYWIELISEDFNRRFDDPADAFRLCLRSDVYDAVADAEKTAAGQAIVALLLAEVATDILLIGLKHLAPEEEITRGGVLHGIITRIERATGSGVQDLMTYAKDNERSRLQAFVHAAFSSRKAIAKIK